jgi:acetyltransferase
MKSGTYRRSTKRPLYAGDYHNILDLGCLLESPYPSQYERRFFSGDGALLLIRPIKPDDATLLVDFFDYLSEQTIFYRFLANLENLPPEWVEHFTRIDYNRDVALVVVEKSDGKDRILGVCRIMRNPGSTRGEVAIVVGDQWQGNAIGSALLSQCIQIARELGMHSLWGLLSTENSKALSLAEKFGFRPKGHSELGTMEVEMTLRPERQR